MRQTPFAGAPRLVVDNKVVIVTGASQGIGAGLVRGFRERNYRVVATSRSIKPSSDPGIVTIASDISAVGAGERVVGEAVKRFGKSGLPGKQRRDIHR